MTMPIISYGEALIDMLAQADTGADTPLSYTRYPGGAPANVAVAVAKLESESYFLGTLSQDTFGQFLLKSLQQYGVDTQFTRFSASTKTALAFISLDADGERSFSFYDDNAAHKQFSTEDLPAEAFRQPAIFNFSSGTLALPNLRDANLHAIELARAGNGLVCFDVNYRSAFWASPEEAACSIRETAATVDIIKASREELHLLYGEDNTESVCREWLDSGVTLLVVTDGGESISYRSGKTSSHCPIPATPVVDTTAAGDAFVGGLLVNIATHCSDRDGFITLCSDAQKLSGAIAFATRCGAVAVSRFGAFTSLPDSADVSW